MRKIVVVVFVLLGFCCKAQEFNVLNPADVIINGVNFRIGSGENDIPLILKTFGKPDRIEDYFFEMDNVKGKKYSYNNGLVLFCVHNSLESFEITGKNYSFTSKNIKVGDAIADLEMIFPLSFAAKSDTVLKINYKNWDTAVLIGYNEDGVITKIEFYIP